MPKTTLYSGDLAHPISVLEGYFQAAGVSLIQAAFAHSYFISPCSVRERVVYFPDRVRFSREHYPDLRKGNKAVWPEDGRQVTLDDNSHAQMAWARYTKHPIARKTGYSVRHVWGHPWNPDAFTAGWNLCYMPFWAGMLTEKQHPHEGLERAIRQASWDLFFRDNPVCQPPGFVEDPGLDLDSLLAGQPLLVLQRTKWNPDERTKPNFPNGNPLEAVKAIRMQTHQSWSNIRKAARSLQGLDHEPFGHPECGELLQGRAFGKRSERPG